MFRNDKNNLIKTGFAFATNGPQEFRNKIRRTPSLFKMNKKSSFFAGSLDLV